MEKRPCCWCPEAVGASPAPARADVLCWFALFHPDGWPDGPALSSDMLLLWTSALLALLCLLPSGQVLHQHAGDVHAVPHHELRRVLPHAVPHRLGARQGEREPDLNQEQNKQSTRFYFMI